ncbi:hypothetical protein QT06_C0001G0888 [archaeon GW2011_AR15]|nr:hypothetical protein QT06_C0001G0888 [archaeon GW2011_AR15]
MPLTITQPEVFYLLIPLAILLFILLRKKFVKDSARLFNPKGWKWFIFAIRMVIFALLLLALSAPYMDIVEESTNLTTLKVLVDKSGSMELYDVDSAVAAISSSSDIPVEIHELEMGEHTALGTAILSYLTPEENILLITDGRNNFGTELKDVALFASSLNSRLFALNLKDRKDDAAVWIEGPDKVVSGVENTFTAKVNAVGEPDKSLKVYVDDSLVYNEAFRKDVEIKQTFTSGNHVIRAVLGGGDAFSQNNIFYKAVSVYEKPKILFVSNGGSPMLGLLQGFYAVDTASGVTSNLDSYYAVVLDNINGDQLGNREIERLEDFLDDGNGLLVVGGRNSYDWGEYDTSRINNLLPVGIGQAKKKDDITNIVMLLDTGASGEGLLKEGITFFDVQKSILVDVLNGISSLNKVAVFESNHYQKTITGLSELGPKKVQLIEDISVLTTHGFSELRFSYQKAHEALKLNTGSKNIVIITDGKLIPQDQALTLELTRAAKADGIKTFIIAVGDSADEEFLKAVKEAGGGEYFRADETNRLKLYFGEPESGDTDDLEIFVYDSNHFITEELDMSSDIYGFNTVYPKQNGRMLLSTSAGDPVLTIWNYGLGRVAAWSTDDGSVWTPDMLNTKNSQALIRTLNWLVEEPGRKSDPLIDIPELRTGENSVITVKSSRIPSGSGISFYEYEKGIYKGNYFPQKTGIASILGRNAAVNYQKEYLNIGMDPELERTLAITGGKLINTDDKEEVASLSTVQVSRTNDLSWLFLTIAGLVYLFEVAVRRIMEMRALKKF